MNKHILEVIGSKPDKDAILRYLNEYRIKAIRSNLTNLYWTTIDEVPVIGLAATDYLEETISIIHELFPDMTVLRSDKLNEGRREEKTVEYTVYPGPETNLEEFLNSLPNEISDNRYEKGGYGVDPEDVPTVIWMRSGHPFTVVHLNTRITGLTKMLEAHYSKVLPGHHEVFEGIGTLFLECTKLSPARYVMDSKYDLIKRVNPESIVEEFRIKQTSHGKLNIFVKDLVRDEPEVYPKLSTVFANNDLSDKAFPTAIEVAKQWHLIRE